MNRSELDAEILTPPPVKDDCVCVCVHGLHFNIQLVLFFQHLFSSTSKGKDEATMLEKHFSLRLIIHYYDVIKSQHIRQQINKNMPR